MKALLVADRFLSQTLQPALEEEGIEVDAAEQPGRVEFKVRTESYDAVVLDRDLLGGVAYSRLSRWRRGGLKAHVLVLLPDDCDSTEKVNALDAGADAYLQRPLSAEELRACFRALNRRDRVPVSLLQAYDLELDLGTRRVRRAGKPIRLTPREFDVLHLLMQQQGRLVTRSMIREYLYDDQKCSFSNAIDVYIAQLRAKIDDGFDPQLILTRWGQGYELRAEGA
jgi:DNA-binding response OmpR family regulator